MEIVRTATYARNLKRLGKLGATDADVIAMENAIAVNPEAGAVIKGSGGMRKIRFGFGGSGKSARTISAASRFRAFLIWREPKRFQPNSWSWSKPRRRAWSST